VNLDGVLRVLDAVLCLLTRHARSGYGKSHWLPGLKRDVHQLPGGLIYYHLIVVCFTFYHGPKRHNTIHLP